MKDNSPQAQQIDIAKILNGKRKKELPKLITSTIARLIHQKEINFILREYSHLKGVEFMSQLVRHFDLNIHILQAENFPKDGRALFVSNHPLGGLDGICLTDVVGKHYGSTVKYIVNDLLFNLKPLQSIFVPVNKYGVQARQSIEKMHQALSDNVPVLTFPAGFCSRWIGGKLQDIEWNKSFIKQAVEYKRDIVPIFFSGRNSIHFYAIEKLRTWFGIKFSIGTALLPDEMFRSKHKTFTIVIGKPIPYTLFASLNSKQIRQSTIEVRNQVYALSSIAQKTHK